MTTIVISNANQFVLNSTLECLRDVPTTVTVLGDKAVIEAALN